MSTKALFVLLALYPLLCHSQFEVVVDKDKQKAEIDNFGVTMATLIPTQQATEELRKIRDDISLKTTVVAEIYSTLYKSLSEVHKAVKDGQNALAIGGIVQDIGNYQKQMISEASGQPVLLFAAIQAEQSLITRTTDLLFYLQENVLKGGDQNLINSKHRMEMLRHVINELRVMRGMAYHALRQIRFARRAGLLQSLPWDLPYPNDDIKIAKNILNNF